jgi:hypothetical protein
MKKLVVLLFLMTSFVGFSQKQTISSVISLDTVKVDKTESLGFTEGSQSNYLVKEGFEIYLESGPGYVKIVLYSTGKKVVLEGLELTHWSCKDVEDCQDEIKKYFTKVKATSNKPAVLFYVYDPYPSYMSPPLTNIYLNLDDYTIKKLKN